MPRRGRSDRPIAEDEVASERDRLDCNVGRVTGYVDLGELGVADRHWDLAVASWSTVWNVGPGHEEAFLRAYGGEVDRAKIRFYRLLYDFF